MDRIRIVGGTELRGEIPISGAKNAALPLMIASLLTKDPLVLENVPRLADVKQLERILENHGVDIAVHGRRPGSDRMDGQRMTFHAAEIVDTTAPYELVSTMRASFWVIGPLLARAHEARVSLPGGCAIGTRPVDLFLFGLKELGAQIEIDEGYVVAKAPKGGLVGARIVFPKVSVGATHTLLMAATLAHGVTVIENAAMEPEITNVAECLVDIGDFRFHGGVFDHGDAVRQGGCHQQRMGGADGDLGEDDARADEATLGGLGDDIALVDFDLGAQFLEAEEEQIDRAGADGAAAGQRDAGLVG